MPNRRPRRKRSRLRRALPVLVSYSLAAGTVYACLYAVTYLTETALL